MHGSGGWARPKSGTHKQTKDTPAGVSAESEGGGMEKYGRTPRNAKTESTTGGMGR